MATDLPFPEPIPAFLAQLRLLSEGRKRAVLVPHFQPRLELGHPGGVRHTPLGTFIFDPATTTPQQIDCAVLTDTVGELLGYGIPRKPESGDRAMVLRMRDGGEKIAVVCDAGTEAAVREALDHLRDPGDTLAAEPPLTVIQQRLRFWSLYFKI